MIFVVVVAVALMIVATVLLLALVLSIRQVDKTALRTRRRRSRKP